MIDRIQNAVSRRQALLMTAGASSVLLTPWGALAASAAPTALTDPGQPGDGATDATDWLATTLKAGGDILIPAGRYLIGKAGGVIVALSATTRVFCHPKAVFVAGTRLDSDMISIGVDSARLLDFEWYGGTFDQTEQLVSKVVPFNGSGQYPPTGRQGEAATTDGLSIRGGHGRDEVAVFGINRCVVMGVTTIGNTRPGEDHWQMAGGDSGIVVGSCKDAYIGNCRNIANRDLGIYATGGAHTGLISRVVIEGNVHINCCHGSAIKRWAERSRIVGNYAENCLRGFQINTIEEIGSAVKAVEISGNLGHMCSVPIRVQRCTGFSVHDNHFTSLGAKVKDPTKVELNGWAGVADFVVDSKAELTGIITEGCTRGVVAHNTVIGLTPGAETARPARRMLIDCVNNGPTPSTFITWLRNAADELRSAGRDTGTNNSFIENVVYNSKDQQGVPGNPHMESTGTGSYEVRLSPTTHARIQKSPLLGGGSVTAPLIASEAQPNTGVYLASNHVGVAVAGKARIRANHLGVAFNGATPTARPVYVAPTGTALRSTFDTEKVSVKELARHVKAIIDDLRLRGDFG